MTTLIYTRAFVFHERIQKITDLLSADLQHNSDKNGALSPSLQVCLALRYFATGFKTWLGIQLKCINLLHVEQLEKSQYHCESA